eukprot:gnl/TRDRNA2_/TRDRNA2_154513_c0_seq1.p1 gnl/TRDRNA2_/TRDRNA2_154513_c0~~gnl/TRDRNA2_/TRDRNA2_154513_c0_seq1.p1  ORF type:complete len:1196 (+),score=213.58 gnl/TRDRNA2_/TRDRNA2_154513_c0_seq1:343-3588(+)
MLPLADTAASETSAGEEEQKEAEFGELETDMQDGSPRHHASDPDAPTLLNTDVLLGAADVGNSDSSEESDDLGPPPTTTLPLHLQALAPEQPPENVPKQSMGAARHGSVSFRPSVIAVEEKSVMSSDKLKLKARGSQSLHGSVHSSRLNSRLGSLHGSRFGSRRGSQLTSQSNRGSTLASSDVSAALLQAKLTDVGNFDGNLSRAGSVCASAAASRNASPCGSPVMMDKGKGARFTVARKSKTAKALGGHEGPTLDNEEVSKAILKKVKASRVESKHESEQDEQKEAVTDEDLEAKPQQPPDPDGDASAEVTELPTNEEQATESQKLPSSDPSVSAEIIDVATNKEAAEVGSPAGAVSVAPTRQPAETTEAKKPARRRSDGCIGARLQPLEIEIASPNSQKSKGLSSDTPASPKSPATPQGQPKSGKPARRQSWSTPRRPSMELWSKVSETIQKRTSRSESHEIVDQKVSEALNETMKRPSLQDVLGAGSPLPPTGYALNDGNKDLVRRLSQTTGNSVVTPNVRASLHAQTEAALDIALQTKDAETRKVTPKRRGSCVDSTLAMEQADSLLSDEERQASGQRRNSVGTTPMSAANSRHSTELDIRKQMRDQLKQRKTDPAAVGATPSGRRMSGSELWEQVAQKRRLSNDASTRTLLSDLASPAGGLASRASMSTQNSGSDADTELTPRVPAASGGGIINRNPKAAKSRVSLNVGDMDDDHEKKFALGRLSLTVPVGLERVAVKGTDDDLTTKKVTQGAETEKFEKRKSSKGGDSDKFDKRKSAPAGARGSISAAGARGSIAAGASAARGSIARGAVGMPGMPSSTGLPVGDKPPPWASRKSLAATKGPPAHVVREDERADAEEHEQEKEVDQIAMAISGRLNKMRPKDTPAPREPAPEEGRRVSDEGQSFAKMTSAPGASPRKEPQANSGAPKNATNTRSTIGMSAPAPESKSGFQRSMSMKNPAKESSPNGSSGPTAATPSSMVSPLSASSGEKTVRRNIPSQNEEAQGSPQGSASSKPVKGNKDTIMLNMLASMSSIDREEDPDDALSQLPQRKTMSQQGQISSGRRQSNFIGSRNFHF